MRSNSRSRTPVGGVCRELRRVADGSCRDFAHPCAGARNVWRARSWDSTPVKGDEPLRIYRQETLKLGLQKVLVLTGSGNIDVSCRLFSCPRVEPWIITAQEGEKNLQSQLKRLRREGTIKIVCVGRGTRVELATATQVLRQQHGIRTLLCEGGPTLYGEFLKNHLMDEDFRTISLQVLGESTTPVIDRPTTYGGVKLQPRYGAMV